MTLERLIIAYLDSKKDSWSESTLKSERSRLSGVSLEMLKDPEALYKFLKDDQGKTPYAIKTAFVRAGEIVEFGQSIGRLTPGPNLIKDFMRERAKLFKNAYVKKPLGINFEEAAGLIQMIDDQESRQKAIELLFAGMRYTESQTLKDGQVVGKGGVTRTVALAKNVKHVDYSKTYTTFNYHLKKVGLSAHMLRKLCATKVVEQGADVADLMKMFGWTHSQTAMIYIQAQKEKEMTEKMALLVPPPEGDANNGKQVSKAVRKTRSKALTTKR